MRKIYINDVAKNNVVTLETDATTFGEVKRAAIAAGIDVNDKDWLEGLTKTIPTSDDALLPTNVPYKGSITNDLVFVLTDTNKKIKLGALSYSEMRSWVKNNNLQDTFAKKYKKHYTQAKTSEFVEFMASYEKKNKKNSCSKEKQTVSECSCKENICNDCQYKEKYAELLNIIATGFQLSSEALKNDILTVIEDVKNTHKTLNLSEEDVKSFFENFD